MTPGEMTRPACCVCAPSGIGLVTRGEPVVCARCKADVVVPPLPAHDDVTEVKPVAVMGADLGFDPVPVVTFQDNPKCACGNPLLFSQRRFGNSRCGQCERAFRIVGLS